MFETTPGTMFETTPGSIFESDTTICSIMYVYDDLPFGPMYMYDNQGMRAYVGGSRGSAHPRDPRETHEAAAERSGALSDGSAPRGIEEHQTSGA